VIVFAKVHCSAIAVFEFFAVFADTGFHPGAVTHILKFIFPDIELY